jgi:hypothetical protein
MKKPYWLNSGDSIVTAYAEYCSGPGWSNAPLCIIVRSENGEIREECLQPHEQDYDVHQLFPISATLQTQMMRALRFNEAFEAKKEKIVTKKNVKRTKKRVKTRIM